MIFQEPMTSLNPVFTIGMQVMEVILAHERGLDARRRARAPSTMLDRGRHPGRRRRG